jgi:hypothetical protein
VVEVEGLRIRSSSAKCRGIRLRHELNLAQVHVAISYHYELEGTWLRMTAPRASTNSGRPST